MKSIMYLILGVLMEVFGTTALKASQGFSHLMPTIVFILSYVLSFFFLGLSLRTIPLGIGYAVWSALGTVFTVLIGIMVWNETLSSANVLGILCIIAGVILLNVN